MNAQEQHVRDLLRLLSLASRRLALIESGCSPRLPGDPPLPRTFTERRRAA